MQASWGIYDFPVDGCEVTGQMSVAEATDYGAPLRYAVLYTVKATLLADGAAALTTAELALRTALTRQNQDFVLRDNSGNATSASIFAALSVNGTKCLSVQTPEAMGGEFVNRRTVVFTVAAEYNVANVANAVISWTETVSITGNGKARRVWRFPINAPPVRQQISPYSLIRATQSGQAVGYMKYPKKPAPLWPLYLVNDAEVTTVGTPKYMAPRTYIDFPVSWSYQFERGDGPLIGVPVLPPGVII